MNILVTGAAGFIGSQLAERLTNHGHQVIGVDSFSDYYPRALKELNAEEVRGLGVTIHERDLAQDDIGDLIDGVEVVYHLAAQPGISQRVPFEDYLRNNLVATQHLVQALQDKAPLECFVNVCTSSVYGANATEAEDVAPKPTSHYGVTKLAAEQLVLARARDAGFPACSLRIFSVYGERERPEKLYPKLIKAILEDKEFPLHEGSERHSRSFTYISDVLDAFQLVLENFGHCQGEIFNIGSDIEITTGRGIQIVEELLGKKARLITTAPRPGDQLRTHANFDKARLLLGYEPKVAPEEGLRAEVEWYEGKVFGKVVF